MTGQRWRYWWWWWWWAPCHAVLIYSAGCGGARSDAEFIVADGKSDSNVLEIRFP